jgi:curved DNA-binding protein CbpA
MEDYYKILEVYPKASFEEIKTAYKDLCKEYHPDKLPPGTPEKARRYVEKRFQQINEAYSVLRSLESRQKYDTSCSFRPVSSKDKTASHSSSIFNTGRSQKTAEKIQEKSQTFNKDFWFEIAFSFVGLVVFYVILSFLPTEWQTQILKFLH